MGRERFRGGGRAGGQAEIRSENASRGGGPVGVVVGRIKRYWPGVGLCCPGGWWRVLCWSGNGRWSWRPCMCVRSLRRWVSWSARCGAGLERAQTAGQAEAPVRQGCAVWSLLGEVGRIVAGLRCRPAAASSGASVPSASTLHRMIRRDRRAGRVLMVKRQHEVARPRRLDPLGRLGLNVVAGPRGKSWGWAM